MPMKKMNADQQSSAAIAVESVMKSFEISDDSLRFIKQAILKEMQLGLADEESATVKMLITYVRDLSRGDESGAYLALDLGGTHFRVLLVELEGGKAKVTAAVHDIPQALFTTPNGQELFDYIALKLLEFVQKYKLKRRRISLGFTFSFPCKQYGLTQSVLVKWNKGFKVGGVVGTDVVKQLKDALKRQLAGLVEAYIDVVAVINDTTGTLVACANSNPNCRIGLIVGTGFNACYMESLERCDKWPANYTSPKQVIVNCEWGAMGDNKELRELDKFRNEFDQEVDQSSINARSQTYEKMVAGMYIGELLRLAMIKLYKAKALFCDMIESNQSESHKLFTKDILDGKHLSMLAKDELSNNFEESTKIMQELNIKQYSKRDLHLVVQLSAKIITRSAFLVAAGISALLERIGARQQRTVIGFDGSVIKHHPYFLRKLNEKCLQLTGPEWPFEFVVSSDGSGIGAAVVAAALHRERRPLYVLKPGKLYELHFVRGQQSEKSQQSLTEHLSKQ